MTAPPSPADVSAAVALALAEDLGSGDVTALLIDSGTHATAELRAKEAATLCGRPWFDEVFRQVDPSIDVEWRYTDGDELPDGAIVCRLTGPARGILSGERTAL